MSYLHVMKSEDKHTHHYKGGTKQWEHLYITQLCQADITLWLCRVVVDARESNLKSLFHHLQYEECLWMCCCSNTSRLYQLWQWCKNILQTVFPDLADWLPAQISSSAYLYILYTILICSPLPLLCLHEFMKLLALCICCIDKTDDTLSHLFPDWGAVWSILHAEETQGRSQQDG